MRSPASPSSPDPSADSTPAPSGQTPNQEIEWQFDAVDLRPVDRWLRQEAGPGLETERRVTATPNGVRRQTDVYADTFDWRLHRGGRVLRVRRRAGGFEATLKSLEAAEDGLRRREEITQSTANGDLLSLPRTEGPVGTVVRTIAGLHPLQPVVEVRTHRTSFDLALDGATVGEVALDSTTIPMGPGQEPARLRRIEVEVEATAVDAVRPFVESLRDACGLRPATVSKMEAGLLAAGLSPASFLDFGPTDVDGANTVGEVAFAVLRTQFRAFLRAEPGARLGSDPEDLHDMRVATRRLRAALKLFAGALPVRSGRLRDELKWVGTALGEVRDLDVQIGQLEEWRAAASEADREALGELGGVLETQRVEARRRLLTALDGPRYERLVTAFGAMLRQGPLRRSPPSRVPILAATPDLLGRRHRAIRRRARRIGSNASGDDYHAVRIQAKRFRYAVEFVSPVYGKRSKKLADRLVALQDLLGEHQDARVAAERLRSLVAEVGSSLSPAAVFAMGSIAERFAGAARHLRGEYQDVYRRIKKPWRRLDRRMARRRPGLPPLPAPPAPSSPPAPDPLIPTGDA